MAASGTNTRIVTVSGANSGIATRAYVAAIPVENLVVVSDFEDEMIDHALCEVDLAVDQQAESHEIAVPVVQFVETSAGNGDLSTIERYA